MALGCMQDRLYLQPETARPAYDGSTILGEVFLSKSTLNVLLLQVMSQRGKCALSRATGALKLAAPGAELGHFPKPPWPVT